MNKTLHFNLKYLTLVSSLLAILVVSVFWQVGHYSFNNFDDDIYVFRNSHIRHGVTGESFAWALRSFYASNWHPLTWLSHMIDIEIFGLSAAWHHRMNLLYHFLNTELLFFLLWRMTGRLCQSFFVAALFGVHPLHVESVAWVAERKDLLSTSFWLLTLAAYLCYAKRPNVYRYATVVAFFSLGLMSKPMLVTLPFVLLLLDWWPLKRLRTDAPFLKEITHLFWEKIPLMVLSGLTCFMTYLAQKKGIEVFPLGQFPFKLRISNAIVSYAVYLEKTIWPASLSVFYPHAGTLNMTIPGYRILLTILLLSGISVWVFWHIRRHPYLIVGWMWYLGTLVPVIGIIQVGAQAHADRYTYIPLIGVFIMIAWGIPAIFAHWRPWRIILSVLSSAILIILSSLAWQQTKYWQDNLTLFTHALYVTENNWLAWNNIGTDYKNLGQLEIALSCYQEAVKIKPDYALAWYNLGLFYDDINQPQLAIAYYQKALRIWPKYEKAWLNIGVIYHNRGQLEQAMNCYQEALRINPALAEARYNMELISNSISNSVAH